MDATTASSSITTTLPRRHRLYLSLFLLLTALLLGSWVCTSELVRQQQRQDHLQRLATSVSDRISISIRNATLPLYSLGELTLLGHGRIEGLAELTDKMRTDNPTILNISVMPNGVVRQIEPLIPHAMALGHDMFLDPERIDDARLARDSKKLTVTGPYNLIQGNQGLIARLPLYQNDRFWGFVSIVFQFRPPFEQIMHRYIAHNDILFQISAPAASTPLIGNVDQMPANRVYAKIQLPNNHWQLQMAYAPAFNWFLALKTMAACSALLLAGYVFLRILQSVTTQHQLHSILMRSNELSARHQAQTQMVAQVSHDLRTPMQYVLNEVKRMAENTGLLPTPVRTIEQNVQYQLNLIDQLLDYSTQSSQERNCHPVPGYMYAFLTQLTEQAGFLTRSRGNRLQLDIDHQLPTVVSADFRQLQRVLINLLSNAAKFTQQGKITLSVEKLSVQDASGRLRFRVQDNGPGMPDMNSRGQHANSGHGLGLMIVTDLLRQMGSHLEYRTNPGGGSDFHFDLELPLPAEAPEPYLERHILDWEGEDLNVLLVDPDPTAAERIEELLLGYGVDVQTRDSAESARQLLQQTSVDLVITEMDLPDGNGWDLLKAAQILPTSVPVMLYASRPAQPSQHFRFAAELLRPAGSDQLLAHIRQLTTN